MAVYSFAAWLTYLGHGCHRNGLIKRMSTVANPQWEYLYLTKFPQRYDRLQLPESGWIGASVDEQHRAEPTLDAMRKVSGVKVKLVITGATV